MEKRTVFFTMVLHPVDGWIRVGKEGALHGETFQRQGDNNWVCVESNRGFA